MQRFNNFLLSVVCSLNCSFLLFCDVTCSSFVFGSFLIKLYPVLCCNSAANFHKQLESSCFSELIFVFENSAANLPALLSTPNANWTLNIEFLNLLFTVRRIYLKHELQILVEVCKTSWNEPELQWLIRGAVFELLVCERAPAACFLSLIEEKLTFRTWKPSEK